MNKLLIFTMLFFGCMSWTNAQNANTGALKIITQTEPGSVKIRWMLTEPASWEEGNKVGYSISRYTTHINGAQLSSVDIQDSYILLDEDIQVLDENQWETQFTDNPFAQVAKGTLYDEDETVVTSSNPTLADVFNQTESKESRYLFGLYAAEQDFEVAKGMALGYEDINVNSAHTYMYRVVLNSSEAQFSNIQSMVSVEAGNYTSYPDVGELAGEGMDKAVLIEWPLIEARDYYSTYDIERSTDDVNFVKVNDVPFVFAAEGTDEPEYAIYKDDVPDNQTYFYYRVRGRTPFGTQGSPSESIRLKGTPPRINVFLAIEEYEDDGDNVVLSWSSQEDADVQAQIEGYNIYRSTSSNTDFVQLNEALLPAGTEDFEDTDPLSTAYYILEAVDVNDYTYKSPSKLIQLSDSEPPVAPVGLTGEFLNNSRLRIEWTPNEEEDLKGYRVLVANKREGNYSQLTRVAIKDNFYVYDIDPTFMVDSIYFKVMATDVRDNYSEKSMVLALRRPDIIPPSKPVLHKVSPTPEGLEFGFKFSTSDDRKIHYLQLKPVNGPRWKDILEIPVNKEVEYERDLTPDATTTTNYFLDNDQLKRGEYQFRMVAKDESGNISGSQIITVRPYDSGLRGEIQNFSYEIVLLEDPDVEGDIGTVLLAAIDDYQTDRVIDYDKIQLLSAAGWIPDRDYDAIIGGQDPDRTYQSLLEIQETRLGYLYGYIPELHFSWIYEYEEDPVDFQIFRSAEGGPMMLYTTLPREEVLTDRYRYKFEDKDVKAGVRYFYQIMARHSGEGFSPRSETLMVLVR